MALYKKRIAIKSKGKRGGARTLLAYKATSKSFFVFGYAKNSRANINSDELKVAKRLAVEMFSYSSKQIAALLRNGALIEVEYDG